MPPKPAKGRKRALEDLHTNYNLTPDDLLEIERMKSGEVPGDWRSIPRAKFEKTPELEGFLDYDELYYQGKRMFTIRCRQKDCFSTFKDTVSKKK